MLRTLGAMMLAVVMLATACPGMAAPAAVTCPRLAVAPTLDGTVGDAEWSGAAALGPFVLARGGGMPSLTTEAFIGYTDEGIFVGARLFDPAPMQIHCYATARDGAVSADDSFALLLDSTGAGVSFLHMAVNAAGAMYDAIDDDASVDFNWSAATGLSGDGWTVEMVARFEGASPKAGDRWLMTCLRNAPRAGERSAWTAGEALPAASELGSLVFGGPAARCVVSPVDGVWFGANQADVTVYNRWGAAMVCKINARVTGPTRRAHSFAMTKITVPANSRTRTELPFVVHRGGPGAVQVSVQVIEGTKAVSLLRTAPMAFDLPPLGSALDDALGGLAHAWQAFAVMPADDRPEEFQAELDSLLARWRYLDSQHAQRSELSRAQLEVLVSRSDALAEDAAAFEAGL
jgi:hypothetical protein